MTFLCSHRQYYSLWTDVSGFYSIEKYFLPGHFTLQAFCENIPTCNTICILSGLISFSSSVATLLLLDKIFSYCFSIRQQGKYINFKKMIAVLQALARWIKIFKGFQLHIFYDNFLVIQDLHKNSIYREEMQLLCRIAILYVSIISKYKHTRFLLSKIF